MSACSVCPPKTPSIFPGACPTAWRACWTALTSAPLVPCFSSPVGNGGTEVDGVVVGVAGVVVGVVGCVVVVCPVVVGGAELGFFLSLLNTPAAANAITTITAKAAAPSRAKRPRGSPAGAVDSRLSPSIQSWSSSVSCVRSSAFRRGGGAGAREPPSANQSSGSRDLLLGSSGPGIGALHVLAHAAGDVDRRACDVARAFAEQKRNEPGDLVGRTETPE